MVQKPQPYYDFELAKIIQWLKENNCTAHVNLKGELKIVKKCQRA